MSKSLEQLKLDAKNAGWPWPIVRPHDERALLDGCRPDFAAAERVRRFFKTALILPRDGGGVKPFRLLDWWYRDVLAQLFGWKRADGRRRFDKGFVTTAKKAAKSTVLSGLAAYMLGFDGEEEAEVYSAAVDRDQASIIYRKVARNVKLSKALKRHLRVVESKKQIWHDASGSRYEAISSDADSSEGLNPHCLIADEVHVWRDRQFFNSLMYGDIARTQPLFLMITTAGDDDKSIGYEECQYAKDLLSGTVYSMSHFAFVAEAGPEREWDDPAGWLEAQPSLRGEVDTLRPRDDNGDEPEPIRIGSLAKLQAKCDEAKASPRKRREFVRYICNRWVVDAENTWLSTEAWNQCAGESIPHFDEPCAGGLDLSGSRDMTSFCQAFQRGEIIDLEWLFWIPAEGLKEREEEWRVPLRDWVAQGWITATPGNVIDYSYIRQAISGARFDEKGQRLKDCPDAIASKYDLRVLAYDPWNSRELCEKQLFNEDGIKVAQHRQGYRSMSEPCKVFERMVLAGKINHGANPVAAWQAKNVVIDTDPAGNIKPNKDKSRSKIDGIVAAIMAVGVVSLAPDDFQRVTGSLFIH